MELAVNAGILCIVVVVVESSFHLYTEIFVTLNFRMFRSFFHYNIEVFPGDDNNRNCCYCVSNQYWRKIKRYLLGISCVLVAFPLHLNPLVKFLQFLMSVLTFSNFVKKYGIMHESTEACDNAIAGAPGIDTALAFFTSLLAWWMLFPAIYTLAKVVTPDGAGIPERFMPNKYKMHNDEIGELNQKISNASSNVSNEVDHHVRRVGVNVVLNNSGRDNNSSSSDVDQDSFKQVGVLVQYISQSAKVPSSKRMSRRASASEIEIGKEKDERHHLKLMGRRLFMIGDEWEYYATEMVIIISDHYHHYHNHSFHHSRLNNTIYHHNHHHSHDVDVRTRIFELK